LENVFRPNDQFLNSYSKNQFERIEKQKKLETYYDVLQILKIEMRETAKSNPSLTRTASYVNMSYSNFKQTLLLLSNLGFCHMNGKGIFVTEKGVEFLKEYQRFNDYLRKIGFL